MKKMQKVLALLMALAMVFSLAACNSGENTDPQITGVKDMTVQAGSEINVLEGISATDAEDGDLTSMIVIESTPTLTFKNGKATPEKAGSYELTYTVTDKAGVSVSEYATLTVTKKTADAVVYKEFDFSGDKTANSHGWEAKIAEGVAATGALKQGAFVFDITNPGNGDTDIQLALSGLAVKAADYRIKIWAKSTAKTYAHVIARDENADGWSTFGGAYNVVISEQIAPLELYFTVNGEGSAELLVNLGKITPDAGKPEETTPENFTVTIDKIEIYEITGTEVKTPVYSTDFASGVEGALSVSAGDGASANVTADGGAGKVTIDSYPTSGGIWNIKTDIALPGVSVEEGVKYYYSFKINASNGQSGECLVESATRNDANRANFNSFTAAAGEDVIVTGVFTAEQSVADPVIRLQIGNPSNGVSSNVIVIDDVVFGKLEGDKNVEKTIHAFNAFNGETTEIWQTFNGTDEDHEVGVGTIWAENGSLFYRIDQGGVTDWHNKLICGYGDNPLVLEADSYYTVEITAKATKNVTCSFFLSPLGNWDPRLSEKIDFTTEEQTFTFITTDTLITDMNFEMLFQFGSEETANLGEVTIEFTSIVIYQSVVE